MERNTQSYTIYSRELAYELVREGFVLENTKPNNKFPGKEVYFFKNSPALQYKIREYIENKN